MKANELRIGNLYLNFEGKISSWGCQDFAILWKNQGLEVDELIKNFISLTEEWLLKLGFEKINSTWYSIGNQFRINIDLNIEFHLNWLGIKVQYVHQLQNLYFALTGEELAIS